VYMSTLPDISFPQKFQMAEYTGSSDNFATENDTKVISVAVAMAMFQGTPDPPPPGSRLRRYLFPFLIN